jgi:hypothetical protein
MEGGGAGYIQGSRVPRDASVGSRDASVGSRDASVGSRNASVGSRDASVGSSRQQGWCRDRLTSKWVKAGLKVY